MMADEGHANSIRKFPVQEMIRKALQVRTVIPGFDWVKAFWVCRRDGDDAAYLRFEFNCQIVRGSFVASHRLRHALRTEG